MPLCLVVPRICKTRGGGDSSSTCMTQLPLHSPARNTRSQTATNSHHHYSQHHTQHMHRRSALVTGKLSNSVTRPHTHSSSIFNAHRVQSAAAHWQRRLFRAICKQEPTHTPHTVAEHTVHSTAGHAKHWTATNGHHRHSPTLDSSTNETSSTSLVLTGRACKALAEADSLHRDASLAGLGGVVGAAAEVGLAGIPRLQGHSRASAAVGQGGAHRCGLQGAALGVSPDWAGDGGIVGVAGGWWLHVAAEASSATCRRGWVE
jgi:hypothetical protein